MKKSLTVLLLICQLICFSQQIVEVQSSFNGRHCDGKHSLCDIEWNPENLANTNTTLYVDNLNLTLVIDRSKLSINEDFKVTGRVISKSSQPQTDTYILDYDLEIDPNISSALGLPLKAYQIGKGNYPLYITSQAYSITFKLKES